MGNSKAALDRARHKSGLLLIIALCFVMVSEMYTKYINELAIDICRLGWIHNSTHIAITVGGYYPNNSFMPVNVTPNNRI